ncbi:MAG: hypothetical protein SAK29_02315 [Scytonema sp. PMC 1069.18]|nr:hypothetical protein [Scytonema sp. PMC 1069.18]MEC4879828.1 hypothetical protein [Scytonema sp. PMC 1070.18]
MQFVNSTKLTSAREILQSFDCQRSNLSTWSGQKVKQHKPLNQFLLERGLYLASDWAILNDTRHEYQRFGFF